MPILLALAVYGFSLLRYLPYMADDAYISFTYAKNWANGQGLSYSGRTVEGYSNFLWICLSALNERFFHLDPLFYARTISVACGIGMLWLMLRIARQCLPAMSTMEAICLGVITAGSACLAIGSCSGLETTLLTFLLIALAYESLIILTGGRETAGKIAIIAVLLSLTRPEGCIYGAVCTAFLYFGSPTTRPAIRRWGVFYLGALAIYAVWKYLYYGNIVPATFYAKPGKLSEGLFYLGSYLKCYGGHILGLLVFIMGSWLLRRMITFQLLLLFIATNAAIAVRNGGDFMPGFRFLAPAQPMFLIALYWCARTLLQALHAKLFSYSKRLSRPVSLFLALALSGVFSLQYVRANRDFESLIDAIAEEFPKTHQRIAAYIAEQPKKLRIGITDIGIIGYYSNAHVIDFAGLTDTTIAQAKGSHLDKQVSPEYILKQRPDLIVLGSLGTQAPLENGTLQPPAVTAYFPTERRIAASLGFAANFRHCATLPVHRGHYYLSIFTRRDDSVLIQSCERFFGE